MWCDLNYLNKWRRLPIGLGYTRNVWTGLGHLLIHCIETGYIHTEESCQLFPAGVLRGYRIERKEPYKMKALNESLVYPIVTTGLVCKLTCSAISLGKLAS